MVQAVLFGSLSTVTDLVDLERRAFNRAFSAHEIDLRWNAEEYANLRRKAGRFSGPVKVVEGIDGLNQQEFYHDLEHSFRELIDGADLKPYDWTRSALEYLAKKRIKVALVSGAERQTVLRVLAAVYPHRASTVFDVITSQEMAAAPKPAPDLYQVALCQLAIEPQNAIAIEATEHGMIASRRAGAATAGFHRGCAVHEQFSEADFELASDMQKTLELFLAAKLAASHAAA